jgi:transcriptional regulator with XRE-family HTH domain
MTTQSARPSMAAEHDSDFATLVAELRKARGLSQGQLARAARLSRTYIYHLETGQRIAPSVRVARAITRALDVHGADRQRLAKAFFDLTSQPMEDEAESIDLFDQRELAAVLVRNTAFPAHSLDRLWYVTAWNRPAMGLFELDQQAMQTHGDHLLAVLFDKAYRSRFRPWEALARRLVSDFKFNTRSLTYLPEYRTLWRRLRSQPDFSRIADSQDPGVGTPPGYVFTMRHSHLGDLMLRTTVSVFSGTSDYSIVNYVPADQTTLRTFEQHGWQVPGSTDENAIFSHPLG